LDAVKDGGIRKRPRSAWLSAKQYVSGDKKSREGPSSSDKIATHAVKLSLETGPILFYWPTERLSGFMAPDYRCQFECDGWSYGSVESWMMANEADVSGHQLLWQKLLQEPNITKQRILFEAIKSKPEEQKWSEGKPVFLHLGTNELMLAVVKGVILEEGIWLKFSHSNISRDLLPLLIATKDRELIYVSSFLGA
jgi:predicted NAD-dependent protein-ADP-ribosyltransferase YbiA (DUF1768 family)